MRSHNSVLNETENANKELDWKARNWLHLIMLVVEQGSMLSKLDFSKAKGVFRLGELRLPLLHRDRKSVV